MLAYAVNDTRYLLALAHRLTDQLQEKGRWSWYEESCERAVLAAAEDREKDPEQAWKIAGSAALAPQTQAILRALWHWRESEAEQMDRPPFQIMRNEDLLAIRARRDMRFLDVDGNVSARGRILDRVRDEIADDLA